MAKEKGAQGEKVGQTTGLGAKKSMKKKKGKLDNGKQGAQIPKENDVARQLVPVADKTNKRHKHKRCFPHSKTILDVQRRWSRGSRLPLVLCWTRRRVRGTEGQTCPPFRKLCMQARVRKREERAGVAGRAALAVTSRRTSGH